MRSNQNRSSTLEFFLTNNIRRRGRIVTGIVHVKSNWCIVWHPKPLSILNLPEESWLDWVVGLQVDLISVDLTQRLPFRMKATMVKAAIEVPWQYLLCHFRLANICSLTLAGYHHVWKSRSFA